MPIQSEAQAMELDIYPRDIIPYLHKTKDCMGEFCVIHRPSNHHMNEWPIIIRVDREYGLAERRCPHGIGHPDPDSLSYIRMMVKMNHVYRPGKPYGPYASDVHGCDGCCSPVSFAQ